MIFTRRLGETIYIGDDIEVTVLNINGQPVDFSICKAYATDYVENLMD